MSSENKGRYAFNTELLNKRLTELKAMPDILVNEETVKKISELAIEITAIAEIALIAAPFKPAYTDEEVRELARHLNAVIKAHDVSGARHSHRETGTIDAARAFLQSKRYFNLNQSDLV